MKCIKGKEIQVLKSAAGYYIGCFDEGPYCRISGYYKTEDTAQTALDRKTFFRDAPENAFCNGGYGCLVDDFDEEEDEFEIENNCKVCPYELEDDDSFDGIGVVRPLSTEPMIFKAIGIAGLIYPFKMSQMKNIKLDGLIHESEVAHVVDGKIYAAREPEIKPYGCSEYGAVTVEY